MVLNLYLVNMQVQMRCNDFNALYNVIKSADINSIQKSVKGLEILTKGVSGF